MKARVTFTDSDGDSGTVDDHGDWNANFIHEEKTIHNLMLHLSAAATAHELIYPATVTKIEIEIIG